MSCYLTCQNHQYYQCHSLVRPKNHAGLIMYIWPIPGHYKTELICKEYLTTTYKLQPNHYFRELLENFGKIRLILS